MRVQELIEQLNKLSPNAQVYLSVVNHTDALVVCMSVEITSQNACVIRDHVLLRKDTTVNIRGVMYEDDPELPRLYGDKHR